MRQARFLLALAVALATAGCLHQQQAYSVIDPATGRPVPVVAQQADAQPQYADATASVAANGRELYSSSPAYAQQGYEQPADQPIESAPPQAAPSSGRGLFTNHNLFSLRPSAPVNGPQPADAPQAAAPQYAAAQPRHGIGGPYVAPAYAYAATPSPYPAPYTLDSGDKLRVVVFGQEGITNSYAVGVDGNINLPLVGNVSARGVTPQRLSQLIAERLKQGYVREPHVSVEVETYRPFFILGEVTTPGQYPYVANMTAETAVAIAGGFSPRAYKTTVELTRTKPGEQMKGSVPLDYQIRPGDTVMVKERWF